MTGRSVTQQIAGWHILEHDRVWIAQMRDIAAEFRRRQDFVELTGFAPHGHVER